MLCRPYPLMHSSNPGFQSKFSTVPVVLLLLTIWLLMHGYHGLTGDGRIYAFQAFARLHPQLANDLYLQNTSQDQFTLFSPLYAWCIGLLGLENSARLLTLSFVCGSWRRIGTSREMSPTATPLGPESRSIDPRGKLRLLECVPDSEPFLTARLPAEALIITALACHVREKTWLSFLLSLAALLVHPLIALPGLIFIICLWLPFRASVVGAIVGVVATLAIAVLAVEVPTGVACSDRHGRAVVGRRARTFAIPIPATLVGARLGNQRTAVLILGVHGDRRDRPRDTQALRCCGAGGAAGLAVALIGGLIGPVAILVQGQAWRWIWITGSSRRAVSSLRGLAGVREMTDAARFARYC